MVALKISDIQAKLRDASAEELAVLERSLASDTRKGVIQAIARAHARLDAEAQEAARIEEMYAFESKVVLSHNGQLAAGVDEVGRGPLAGPLAVGAVVFPRGIQIARLNDSKKLTSRVRQELAQEIKEHALAWAVEFIEPSVIDAIGMTASLKKAFSAAVATIEAQGIVPDVVLLDGNPLHFDKREVNIIKGDGRCPSIAAASIIAKEERDALMVKLAQAFPQYGFDIHKGYGTEQHRNAIHEYGLTEVHRRSFCTEFTQTSLF